MKPIWKIGVTGGIGAGKSNVLNVAKSMGVPVINSDIVAHKAYEPGTRAFQKIIDTFGKDLLTPIGSINRQLLGSKVFGENNENNLKKLNDIVWPAVKELTVNEITDLENKGAKVVMIEAALMLEAGWKPFLDEIWLVYIPPNVAKERIMKRNNLTAEEAEKRINSQMSNNERIAQSDVLFNTDCPIEVTNDRVRQQLEKVFKKLNIEKPKL